MTQIKKPLLIALLLIIFLPIIVFASGSWHKNIEKIVGTKGDDQLIGNAMLDSKIRGRAGNDYIFDAGGYNLLIGDSGNDYINGGNGYDVIEGGDDNDFMDGGGKYDTVYGGKGDDVCIFNLTDLDDNPVPAHDSKKAPDNDSFYGNSGYDTLKVVMTNEHVADGYRDYIESAYNSWDRSSDLYLEYKPAGAPAERDILKLIISTDVENLAFEIN